MNQIIEISEKLETNVDFISSQELQDAKNLAKARVHYFKSLGWLQFSNEELLSEAYSGISEAMCRFNPDKGTVKQTKFTSYAYFWIDKKIQEYIARYKTMLSGNLSEHWRNEIPYTMSIDMMVTSEDSGGIDHIFGLRDNDMTIEEKIENDEKTSRIKELLNVILEELEPMESTCFQLLNGIGTISGEPMSIKEISKSVELPAAVVISIIENTKHKLHNISAKFVNIYKEIAK